MTPPLSAERVGEAFGVPDVAVLEKPPTKPAQGTPVERTTWEYRSGTDAGFRVAVVVARWTPNHTEPRVGTGIGANTEAVVRGASQFGVREQSPQRWLTGIGEHAALSRSDDGAGVAAAAVDGDELVIAVLHASVAATPDELLIELAEEAFAGFW